VGDVLFDLRSGDGLLAILPLAEVARAMRDDRPWLEYTLPEGGSPLDSRGVAVLAGNESPEQASAFLQFLGSEAGQVAALQRGFWFLGRSGFSASALPGEYPEELTAVTAFRPWSTDYTAMAARLPAWLEHWRMEIRGTANPLP
jgi:ABC-type Fe3+ transport system substrate-binding protein